MSLSICCARAVNCEQLIRAFDTLFLESERTCLRGGAEEPLYEPPGDGPAVIHFREDYRASALHEIAHWCIAGRVRRQQLDYGYWYAPDGRDAAQQQRFMTVEARPQAVEWCLARAAGLPFRLSLDNLDAPASARDMRGFGEAVLAQVRSLQRNGLPPRAQRFHDHLAALRSAEGAAVLPLAAQHFHLDELL
mgnify:CR=1 FL=1